MVKPLNVGAVNKESFSLEPELQDGRLVLRFVGNGDMEAAPTMGPYLRLIHAEAQAQSVREVVVDMHELYFMNSSCFKAFVAWIDQVSGLGDKGYQIRIWSEPNLHWQRRSLEAMRRIAPEVVKFEPYSEAKS